MKVSVLALFTTIEFGAKFFAIAGGDIAEGVFVGVLVGVCEGVAVADGVFVGV